MNTDAISIPPAQNRSTTEDKTVAIVGYLTFVGFIVAVVMHNSKKTKLGAFHLRQSLGLMIGSFAIFFLALPLGFIPVLGAVIDFALYIGLLVLWVTGLLAAVNGEFKPVAVVGKHFEKLFGTMFE